MNTNPQAKRVLLYGDSLVYWKIPWGARYDVSVRFSGQTQTLLWSEYDIIEEGLRWRMLKDNNTYFPHRDGLAQFGPIIASHMPVDLIVISLWTNDMNSGVDKSFGDISDWVRWYIEQIDRWCVHFNIQKPQVLLVCPPVVREEYSYAIFKDIFRWAEAKSLLLSDRYSRIAHELSIHLLDLSSSVAPSNIDGIHLDEEGNKNVAEALSKKIQEIL